MTKDEAKKFHQIARQLAVTLDEAEVLRERLRAVSRDLDAIEKQECELKALLQVAVSRAEPRALFVFDGKTALTVLYDDLGNGTNAVEFHYDRRVLRGA